MASLKSIVNALRYGMGPGAREKKRAAKKRAKEQRFSSEAWEHGDEFARRRYGSYDDYVSHQASKLDDIYDRLVETEPEVYEEFVERFRACAPLADARTVLCLGARLGTEVRALHSLGHFAVGIDLNPGPKNPYVLPGDFHDLVFADGSVDCIYTNALDHVFELEKVIAEATRVLAPGGIFLAEFEIGFSEGHTPGSYEATHWRDSQQLIDTIRDLGKLEVEQVDELGDTRRGDRKLVVFRKP